MAEQIPAPKPLKLGGNIAENWRCWKKTFELYMTATEKDKKSQRIQYATFLTLAGEAAIAVHETLVFEETEKDKIEPLKAQYHLLSDVILRLRNNITIMYFDRYLSCFGINIQLILVNLYKLKIEY